MRLPRPRLSVRMMIGLVAVSAVLIWGWMTYFDPVRRWKVAIRDDSDVSRLSEALAAAPFGQVPGLSPDQAIDEFLGLIGDQGVDPLLRWKYAEAVARFKAKAHRAIPTLVATLRRDGSASIRLSAVVAIRQILGDHPEDGPIERDAVAAITAALNDPDRKVRRWSACCLGWIGRGELAIPTLVQALNEPDLDSTSQRQILSALDRSGPKAAEALPALLEMTKVDWDGEGNGGGEGGRQIDADALIRAAKLLHAFGRTDRAVAILRKLAGDRNKTIAAEASKTLNGIESTMTTARPDGSP